MANDAGKITIHFDADMTDLSNKLKTIEERIAKLGDGGGAAGAGGTSTPRRRVQASTLGGSAPVDSVSDAPTIGAHAQAAAAGITTPVGVPTSFAASSMRSGYPGGRSGIVGGEAEYLARMQYLSTQVGGLQGSPMAAERLAQAAADRAEAARLQSTMMAGGSSFRSIGGVDVSEMSGGPSPAMRAAQSRARSRSADSAAASVMRDMDDDAAFRQFLTDNVYGGMGQQYRQPRRSSMARRPFSSGLGLRQLGGAFANPGSILGLYFGAAFGGMELQAASSAMFSGINQEGSAVTVADALNAQSGIMASQYGGPVGSIIANASALQYGLGFGGGQAAYGSAQLAGMASRATAGYQSRLAGVQSATALEVARGSQLGGMAGQLQSAKAQMDAGIQVRMMGLAQQQGAMMTAMANDPRQSVLQAAGGGAIVGATMGGGLGLFGGPLGAAVFGGSGAAVGGMIAAINTSGANAKAMQEKQSNIAAMQARIQMANVQAAQFNEADQKQYDILVRNLNYEKSVSLAGMGIGARAAGRAGMGNTMSEYLNSLDEISLAQSSTLTRPGVGADEVAQANRLADARRGAARFGRSMGFIADRAGMLSRDSARRIAMGDTLGGFADARRSNELAGYLEERGAGFNSIVAQVRASANAGAADVVARGQYASSLLSLQAQTQFDRTILSGGTPFEAQRNQLRMQGASALAQTQDPRMQQGIASSVAGGLAMIDRNQNMFRNEVGGNFAAREAVLSNRGNPYAGTLIGAGAASASRIRSFIGNNERGFAEREFNMLGRELTNMMTPYQGSQVGNPLAYAGVDGGMAEKAKNAALDLAKGALNENPNAVVAKNTDEMLKLLSSFVEWIKAGGNN